MLEIQQRLQEVEQAVAANGDQQYKDFNTLMMFIFVVAAVEAIGLLFFLYYMIK